MGLGFPSLLPELFALHELVLGVPLVVLLVFGRAHIFLVFSSGLITPCWTWGFLSLRDGFFPKDWFSLSTRVLHVLFAPTGEVLCLFLYVSLLRLI